MAAASQDPNLELTRAVRRRRRALSDSTASVLGDMKNVEAAQESIRALEAAHALALAADARACYDALLEKGRLRSVAFEERDLGVSFILARFDAVDERDDGARSAALSRRLVVVETTRPLGVARRMLAPTDELVGVDAGHGDVDLVVDPTVEAFGALLARLRDAPRPLSLVFALGPQREAANAAAVAAEREEARHRAARRASKRAGEPGSPPRKPRSPPKPKKASVSSSFLEAAFGDADDDPGRVRRVQSAPVVFAEAEPVGDGAAKEGADASLGRFPLVSANFWTSDHRSERSRRADAFFGTRARAEHAR